MRFPDVTSGCLFSEKGELKTELAEKPMMNRMLTFSKLIIQAFSMNSDLYTGY